MESQLPSMMESRPSGLRKRKWKPLKQNSTGLCQEEQSSSCTRKSPSNKMLKSSFTPQVWSNDEYLNCSIMRLPDELLAQIVLYLRPADIGRLAQTCRRFYDVIEENHIWKALFSNTFSFWNNRSRELSVNAMLKGSWKRQYCLNYTKGITYQLLGGANAKRRTANRISDTPLAFGYKKLCSTRDHVFALDMTSCLHVFRSRWERDAFTNEFVFRRTDWHQEFAKHVIDVTTDPRYDNNHRRYVYVLTQSETMRLRRRLPNTRSAPDISSGWNEFGSPVSGDKIDVFDERSCRRVFNMTFDPEMRFIAMKLTSFSPQLKTLFILTDAGKVYSLQLDESSLLNLGSEGMQVTLKSASKTLGEKVVKVETSVGIVAFVTEKGKLHVIVQRKSEFADIFGRSTTVKLGVPQVIPHIAKIIHCSIGDRHIGFIDEYNRAFVLGNNRYGQLGTGDRMDRSNPVQVLCGQRVRILHCGLNHTMAVVERGGSCELLGTGCGSNGRLPGKARGCVEFSALEVKVPWGVRQIDAHKETLFTLSCWDISQSEEYKEQHRSKRRSSFTESLAIKSNQELLMEMKKTKVLLDKIRIVEAMVDGIELRASEFENSDTGSASSIKSFAKPCRQWPVACSNNDERNSETFGSQPDLKDLKRALELLRQQAEREELDRTIASEQQGRNKD